MYRIKAKLKPYFAVTRNGETTISYVPSPLFFPLLALLILPSLSSSLLLLTLFCFFFRFNRKGEIKKIQVLAEQKQGRFVTKVSGLEAFGINLGMSLLFMFIYF